MLDFTGPTTVHVHIDARELRRALRAELAPIKELLMTVADDLTELKATLAGTFADLAAKIQRLQDSVDNPSTESHLSDEDAALLAEIKQVASDARASVGDEDNSDVPPPPVEPTA